MRKLIAFFGLIGCTAMPLPENAPNGCGREGQACCTAVEFDRPCDGVGLGCHSVTTGRLVTETCQQCQADDSGHCSQ
jgi:hypothetical protein